MKARFHPGSVLEHPQRMRVRRPRALEERGHAIAEQIHNSGQAIVWSGPKETAEHYWQQLDSAGLTMAPLERS